MADLLGQDVALNYKGILNLETLNAGISGTLKNINDGEGNPSNINIATVRTWIEANSASAMLGLGIGSDTLPTAYLHLRSQTTYDYLFRTTNTAGVDFFSIRPDLNTSEGILSKYGYMCENSGSFQIAGFGATFGGDRVHLYSGVFFYTSAPTEGVIMAIGPNPAANSPDASLLLDMRSTTKGFASPRMTTGEFVSIGEKATGTEAFSTDDGAKLWYDGTRVIGFRYNGTKFQGYDGSAWVDLN